LCISVVKISVGLHFVRYSHKIIWSPCLPPIFMHVSCHSFHIPILSWAKHMTEHAAVRSNPAAQMTLH
jgi:hypothetical protein